MWCPSYSPNYFSLADILATEERVPLVTKTELPQLGFLDAVSLDLGLSTKHELNPIFDFAKLIPPKISVKTGFAK